MSDDLINHNDDLRRLVEEGFDIVIYNEAYLIIENIPYVDPRKKIRRGRFICSMTSTPDTKTVTPTDHTMWFLGSPPCDAGGNPITQIISHSNRQLIVDDIWGDHYFSSYPEGKGKYDDFYEKVVAYERKLGRPARAIDATANARSEGRIRATSNESVFKIPDTFSARYEIDPLKVHFKDQRIAIVGLGGTGSYVLDLVAKCAVRSIDLFDGDQLLNHNLFRSPGMPTEEETRDFPAKVDYYSQVYGRMHGGISPHSLFLEDSNIEALRGFNFCFVCVDRGDARELVTRALTSFGIPFIDVGIGVGLVDNALDGVVRVTSVMDPERDFEQAKNFLPFSPPDDDDIYEKHVQIADLNSLNASLAVLRWKRWCGYFRDYRDEINSRYMIEGNMLTNRPRA